MNNPTVSVFIVTYNHEKFISEAIESALMQKTNFEIEIVIGEDSGYDNTLNICKNYAQKFSNVRLLPKTNNLGVSGNWKRVLLECNGKYIALCEGDDFWTDENKLQKQIDFLENNKDYIACFHNSNIINENGQTLSNMPATSQKSEYNFTDCIQNWFVPTASLVFKNDKRIIDGIRKLSAYSYVGTDRLLVALITYYGKLKYINEVMCSYRKHDKAVSRTYLNSKIYTGNVTLFKSLKSYIYPEYKKELTKQIFRWQGELSLAYLWEKKHSKFIVNIFKTILYIRSFNDFKTYVKNYILNLN